MDFTDRLKKIIKETGLIRDEFADSAGVSQSQLYRYLNGEQEPSTSFYRNIKKHFPWINIDWLITGIGEPYRQTRGARYKDLRETLKITYNGENREKIFNLLEKEGDAILEKIIFLYTIMTFLNKATENEHYFNLLQRWSSVINKDNVGVECEESKQLVQANLLDADKLFELAQFGYEYDQPGLVFFFYQIFDFLELWEYDLQTMTAKIKLFNEEFVTYNPFMNIAR